MKQTAEHLKANRVEAERQTKRARSVERELALSYIIAASILFIVLAILVKQVSYFPIDLAFTRFIQSFRNPTLDLFMKMVGLPGYWPQTVILNAIFVVILYFCRMKWAALSILVVGSFTGLSGTLLRYTIDRPRPSPELVWVAQKIENGHFSFPSGHVVGFTAILGFMIFLGLTQLRPSWHRNLILALYAFYIALVGVSRIYVGEHWLTDVLGGYLYGSICLVLIILFYRWIEQRAASRRRTVENSAPKGITGR